MTPGLPGRLVTGACLKVLLGIPVAYAQMQAETEMGIDTPMDMGPMQGGSAPAEARDPHAYAEGVSFTRGDGRPRFADEQSFRSVKIDNLEVSRVDGETVLPYDLEAWLGPTYNRAVLKAEGDLESGELAEARTELLWGRAFAPYWDTQVGIRYDSGAGPNRTWLAAGIEGLAPYWFDLEITAYLGESSRTALRLDASYDLAVSQRLILEPSIEANVYGKSDPERGLGTGLSEVALGLRLRYEFRRELAPYVGIEWSDQYGGTEAFTRAAGDDPSDTRLTIGLRFWF